MWVIIMKMFDKKPLHMIVVTITAWSSHLFMTWTFMIIDHFMKATLIIDVFLLVYFNIWIEFSISSLFFIYEKLGDLEIGYVKHVTHFCLFYKYGTLCFLFSPISHNFTFQCPSRPTNWPLPAFVVLPLVRWSSATSLAIASC